MCGPPLLIEVAFSTTFFFFLPRGRFFNHPPQTEEGREERESPRATSKAVGRGKERGKEGIASAHSGASIEVLEWCMCFFLIFDLMAPEVPFHFPQLDISKKLQKREKVYIFNGLKTCSCSSYPLLSVWNFESEWFAHFFPSSPVHLTHLNFLSSSSREKKAAAEGKKVTRIAN